MVRIGASVLLVVLALAGCTKEPAASPGPTTQAAAPTATASATPAASPTPSVQPVVYTADGVGPYVFGAKLADMQAAKQLDRVTQTPPECGDNTYAYGVGVYKDVHLHFSAGVLKGIWNRSADIPTAAGAKLGNTLAQLQTLYGKTGKKVLKEGTDEYGYIATTSPGRGIMFYFDKNGKVHTMAGGEPQLLEDSFQYDLDC